ncbi:MAG: hypothetical protein IKL07_00455 [Clostridium sp.]|nr:hypothetical protein [Clostridium sp.]
MQQINVYIEQQFIGNFKAGDGKFSVVLELNKDGRPRTREHYRGYRGTTKNRLAILSCIEALNHITKPCEITIFIDSPYMQTSSRWLESWIKEGLEGRKNADLWAKYYKLSSQHLITIENKKVNDYSPAMRMQLGIKEIVTFDDYIPENEI